MAQPLDPGHTTETRPAARDDRSLGELFAELTRETTTLIRQEMELARAEMGHKAAEAGKDVAFLAAGGAVAYAGFLALLAALIIALAYAIPWWLSALLVGIVVAAIGGFLVWKGLTDLRRGSLTPQQTVETLKEDARWAKDRTP